MLHRYTVFILLALLYAASVGATKSAPFTVDDQTNGVGNYCLLTDIAPAAAPEIQIDSLPQGRHVVNSYRNGSSTKVVVENGEIQSLEIDGKTIPANEYDEYLPMVERMMGTGSSAIATDRHGIMTESQLERMLENYETDFEGLGQRIEEMAERFAQQIEDMVEGHSQGTYRFEFKHEDSEEPLGEDGQLSEDEQVKREIKEMETMIEKLERRKAQLEKDMDRQENDVDRISRDTEKLERDMARMAEELTESAKNMEADYSEIAEQIIDEGLADVRGKLKSISVDNERLKLNGKSTSDAAHARFKELYQEQTGKSWKSGTKVSIKF